MMKMNLQLFAHKKGVGSTKNGRDSRSIKNVDTVTIIVELQY